MVARATQSSDAWSAFEAAIRLGDTAALLVPSQPWRDIRGMGNRLRHAYDRISVDVIWNAIGSDLPALAADVRTALDLSRKPVDPS
jgi:uncharacterized protein with HEPN domain